MIALSLKKSLRFHDLNADLCQQRFDDGSVNAPLTQCRLLMAVLSRWFLNHHEPFYHTKRSSCLSMFSAQFSFLFSTSPRFNFFEWPEIESSGTAARD
jgi:hypothetical protein